MTGKGKAGKQPVFVLCGNALDPVTLSIVVCPNTMHPVSKVTDWFIETITKECGEVVSMNVVSKGVPHNAWASNRVFCLAGRISAGRWRIDR